MSQDFMVSDLQRIERIVEFDPDITEKKRSEFMTQFKNLKSKLMSPRAKQHLWKLIFSDPYFQRSIRFRGLKLSSKYISKILPWL